jgi:hypothetical protein
VANFSAKKRRRKLLKMKIQKRGREVNCMSPAIIIVAVVAVAAVAGGVIIKKKKGK